MTGCASIEAKTPLGTFSWDLRSVNQRYLETFIKLPDSLRHTEGAIRNALRENLDRGKVEVLLKFEPIIQESAVSVNEALAAKLIAAAKQVQSIAGHENCALIDPLSILQWPGVLDNADASRDELSSAAMETFGRALLQLIDTRTAEGEKLRGIIEEKLNGVEAEVAKVRAKLPEVVAWQTTRLRNALSTLKEDQIDESRIAQEIILMSQRLDVAEELDRLDAHVKEARNILQKGGSCGRRLDFLLQEFNRESNTLASKSINAEITASAIELKVLIEQIREQIQNIE